MDLTSLTEAQIDQLWLDATAPFRAKFEQANALDSKVEKYRRYGGTYAERGEVYAEQARAIRTATIAARNEAEAPFLAEWDRRGGWSRAYIVPGGHIHKTTACHSLHPTTIIAWLPELSGQGEGRIVEAAGIMACTLCYPSAPVEALRAAERAAKAATECPGSRSYQHTNWRRTSHTGSGRAKCNACGNVVGTSTTGKLRAHKASR